MQLTKNLTATIRRGVLGLATAAALIAGLAPAAPAGATSATFTRPISTATVPWSLRLDVSGASSSNGAPVILWWANGNANQSWRFEQTGKVSRGTNVYRLRNANSGKCLTTSGVPGSQLYQYTCAQGDLYQEWATSFPASYDGHDHQFVNPAFGLAIDVLGSNFVPGGQVGVWHASDAMNQVFV